MAVAVFVVERYMAGADAPTAEALGRRLAAAAADLRDQGASVTWLGTIALPGEDVCLCLFRGSEASIVAANERAGDAFERVMPAEHVTP